MRTYLGLAALVILLSIVVISPLAAQNSSAQADAEALVNEYMAATEALDLDRIIALFADRLVWEDPGYGAQGDYFTRKAQVEAVYRWLFSLPEVQLDNTDYFVSADGGRATVEWTWAGTHEGEAYEIRGVSILDIEDSKIVREVIYYDPTTAP